MVAYQALGAYLGLSVASDVLRELAGRHYTSPSPWQVPGNRPCADLPLTCGLIIDRVEEYYLALQLWASLTGQVQLRLLQMTLTC